MFIRLICLTALLFAGIASAIDGPSLDGYLTEQRNLRASVESLQGKYARLTDSKRAKLYAAQDRIFALLDQQDSLSDLDANSRRELQAADVQVRNIVASLNGRSATGKTVCRREKKLGTHRPELICRKISASDRTATQTELRRMQNQGGQRIR